jgi:hypothetical protein
MGRKINLSRLGLGDMGIDLGSSEIYMTQKLLNHPQVGTTVQKMGSKAMAQHVRVNSLVKPSLNGISLDCYLNSTLGEPFPISI